MLTDPILRSKVDALWDKLWSGGLPNPSDVIEQLSFLLFLKRLDEKEQDHERAARLRDEKFKPIFLIQRCAGPTGRNFWPARPEICEGEGIHLH